MNKQELFAHIAALPMSAVKAAYADLIGGFFNGKTAAAGELAGLIARGDTTLDAVMAHAPQTATPAPAKGAPEVAAMQNQLLQHGSALSNITQQLDDLRTGHKGLANSVANQVSQLSSDQQLLKGYLDKLDTFAGQAITEMTKRTDLLKDMVNDQAKAVIDLSQNQRVADPADVAAEVRAAVAQAFKPFEQAVVAAGAEDVIGEMVAVSRVDRKPAVEVFGIEVKDAKGNEVMVDIYDDASSPPVDTNFVWSETILKHLLLSQTTGENLWFGGEKGTGKSETVRQFAAKTGRGYCRINFHKYTTSEDYIGSVGLENGQTVFKEGDFLRAFTHPATLILLDEITNADPAALATLNGFLEPNSAVSFGGTVRRRAADVLVFAADNTLTNGDETGRYSGTRSMNSALADRFSRVIAFIHMTLDQEVEAVMRHTGCKDGLARLVLKAVHACRAKVNTGDIIDAPSIRSVLAFIRSVSVLGVDEAWATSIGNRQPSESATAIEGIKAAYISAEKINQYL